MFLAALNEIFCSIAQIYALSSCNIFEFGCKYYNYTKANSNGEEIFLHEPNVPHLMQYGLVYRDLIMTCCLLVNSIITLCLMSDYRDAIGNVVKWIWGIFLGLLKRFGLVNEDSVQIINNPQISVSSIRIINH